MATPKKEAEVQRLEELLSRSAGIYLTDFTGLNVEMMTNLRRRLRDASIEYRVAKNSLVSRALSNVGLLGGHSSLVGPTGIVCTKRDPLSAAKTLTAFVRESGRLKIKSGFLDGKAITDAEVDELSRLPSKEVLLGQAIAVLQSPTASFLAILLAPMRELMGTLSAAVEKQREQTTEEMMEGTIVESGELSQIIEQIDKLRVFELNQLSKALQDRWGVTAAVPVAAAGTVGEQVSQVAEPEVEEQTEFDVILAAAGDKKIQVIKVVRAITSLGLKEAKALVDEAPKPVKEGVTREEADSIKAQLVEVGATIEIK